MGIPINQPGFPMESIRFFFFRWLKLLLLMVQPFGTPAVDTISAPFLQGKVGTVVGLHPNIYKVF